MSSCRSEKTNSQISKRLKRIEGQIRGINRMIDEDRDCIDIMHQIQSANSALRGVWEILAASHIENCLANENNDKSKKATIESIVKYIKDLK